MRIKFWSFSKRCNSTKIPITDGEEVSFVYKDSADFHNPIISLSVWNNTWNYAQIESTYFFVDSCEVVTNNLFTIRLRIDLLATYKTDILNTNAFVTRASNGYNKYLMDDFNLPLTKINKTILQGSDVGFYESGEGCYILEVSNALTLPIYSGFNAACILTNEQMHEVAKKLMTDQGIIGELTKIFNKPIDAIIRCSWLPINYDNACAQTYASSGNLFIGSYDTGITVYFIGMTNTIEAYSDFDLSPYIANNYLRNPKYTDILLCIPYVGTVAIDTRQIVEASNGAVDENTLRIRIIVNIRSGKQLVIVSSKANLNAPFNTYETIIADERPISSASQDLAPVLYSAAAAVPMSMMGTGWIAGSLASIATASVESAKTVYSSVGTSGSSAFMNYGMACRCIILEREKSYEPNNDYVRQTIGFPVNKALALSTIANGFIQTINANVSINGYYSESLEINSLLNGGVYIE